MIIVDLARAAFLPWYYRFPKGAFFLGSICGAGLMSLIILKFVLAPKTGTGITSVPVLIGIFFLSSICGFVFGRYLLMFGAWFNSRIWRVFRIPPAPFFFEQALAEQKNRRLAILAGTLKWTEESSYSRALKLLDPDHRGAKDIYLFYKAGLNYKIANAKEYQQTMNRVCKLVSEHLLLQVYPNPGDPEIEGCLSPKAFALIDHLLSPQEFQLLKERWERRPHDKRGPEPCNDFVVVFRNPRLVKTLWNILDSYRLMKFSDTDPGVEKACEKVKKALGFPAD